MPNGIDKSKIEEVSESYKKAEVEREEDRSKIKKKEKTWKILAIYFAHGLAFSLLFTVLVIAWTFGLIILTVLGSWIGLIIGFGLLILIIGFINAVITELLWFPVRWEFWDMVLHGFVLFIALLIVNSIFLLAPSLAFPGTATRIITVIIGSFIDGFVCKKVASLWGERRAPKGVTEAIEAEWKDKKL